MTFEQSKNIKALTITAAIHVLLLLIFLLVRYTLPAQEPAAEMLMEVNLGTSDNGSGTDQPEIPEDPAAADAAVANTASSENHNAADRPMHTADDADAPVVANNTAGKSRNRNSTASNNRNRSNVVTNSNTQNTNTRQQAKYVMPGGTGRGGNSAANNKPGSNEGIGTGNGDMGVPGGTPGAKNYFGTSYRLGNRQMVSRPDRNAEFNEGGKVIVNVTVDRDGIIKSYRVTSAANSKLKEIAERKLKSIRFNKAPSAPVEQFGDITFVFKATRKD